MKNPQALIRIVPSGTSRMGKWAALLLLVLASCQKKDARNIIETGETTESFKEVTAPENFNWDTRKKITLEISPLETSSTEKYALQVFTETGELLFQHGMTMQEGLQQEMLVPADARELVVQYGSIRKQLEISNGGIRFDFLTPIPAEFQ